MFFNGENRIKDGMKLERQGRFLDALAVYDKILARNNVTPELRWRLANVALNVNFIPRAIKELNVLLATNKFPHGVTRADVKALIATCFIASGKQKEALLEIKEAMRLNSNIPSLNRDLGIIYCSQGQTKKGIIYLEKYSSLNQQDVDAAKTLGIAYLDAGDPKHALRVLDRVFQVKKNDSPEIHLYLGILYLCSKNFPLAIQNLNAVLNKKTNQEIICEAYKNLAICYRLKNLPNDAIACHAKATENAKKHLRETTNKINMYNHGIILAKNNKLSMAKDVLSQLIMIDPGFQDTRIAIDSIDALLADKTTDYKFKYINYNPTKSILSKGLLHVKPRFNIEAFEAEIDAKLDKTMPATKSSRRSSASSGATEVTVDMLNKMAVKDFKEVARKITTSLGYTIKSDIKFQGDIEYMNGNAVNYLVEQVGDKNNDEKVFGIRRFGEEVTEISVESFIDWLAAREIKSGIYIASNAFNKNALQTIKQHQNIKFIDNNGLARILTRIK